MHRPPSDPRHRSTLARPTWRNVLAGYALMAAVLLSLWVVSYPLAGAVVLAVTVGLVVGARRASRLARCLSECRRFTVDLGGRVRITVTRAPIDDSAAGTDHC